MKFISTRGGGAVNGAQAIVRGMAADGGLFVPEAFPTVSKQEIASMIEMDYPERAAFVLHKFFDEYREDELLSACREAYSRFE